jgi:hypothetical protein
MPETTAVPEDMNAPLAAPTSGAATGDDGKESIVVTDAESDRRALAGAASERTTAIP